MKKYIIIILLGLSSLLVACNNKDILEEILDSITIPHEVTEDLDLKNEYTVNGITATAKWHSTASSVITNQGKIFVTVEDQNATLILTLMYQERTIKKNFDIVVKGSEDFLVLYAVLSSQINFSSTITDDLNLAATYEQDGKIVNAVWTSSNLAVIDNTGKVTRTDFNVEVELTVQLTLNQASRTEKFTVIVLQKEDAKPVNYFHLAGLWTDNIVGEASDPATPSCFPGAVYRKVVSSKDYWLGIEAVVTIPEFIPDELRYDENRMSYYLDNASLYMGGNATYESDIGLTWSIGHVSATNKSISKQGIAFRPFWRYITAMETGKKANIYKNANVNDYEYYYFPGDKIRISVFSPKENYLQMRIELLELTTHEKYLNARDKYNLETNFNRIFTTDPFPSEGMGKNRSEFKRVNAIDQVGNEAKPTINTNAIVDKSIWHEVYLYRKIGGTLYKVPMTENRSAGMTCPLGSNVNGDFSNAFKITYTGVDKNLGGEVVTISPNNGNGKLYNVNNYYIIPKKPDEEFV